MEEKTTAAIIAYEPPALVELGAFCEDTLGFGQDIPDTFDWQQRF